MNRVVREHYPVSKLPEDLRQGFEGRADVRVTIDAVVTESGLPDVAPRKTKKTLDELFAMSRPTFTSVEDINDHLRALREEWD